MTTPTQDNRWQPIEALQKYEPVDIWVVPPRTPQGPFRNHYSRSDAPQGRRIPNCVHRGGWVHDGRYVTGRWYFDDEGDECVDPSDASDEAFKATHFMPIPSPPEDTT